MFLSHKAKTQDVRINCIAFKYLKQLIKEVKFGPWTVYRSAEKCSEHFKKGYNSELCVLFCGRD